MSNWLSFLFSRDWYNLEKSKRVKAFRCGDYDECIEKAKASAASSSKKQVKYARREDAILHALELESAHQSKDHQDVSSKMGTSGGKQLLFEEPAVPHSSKEIEHMDEESSSFEDHSNSPQELSQSVVSFEEPNHVSASREQGRPRRTPNDSEDDGTEGVKRMRGLEDLGMGVVSSLKRKRSEVAHVHEFLKRKNRRRPLTKVLESTAMVSVPVTCEQIPSPNGSPLPGVSDSKVSGLESNESKRSLSVVLNNSDSTGVSCENGISVNASGHASDVSLVNNKQKENEISSMSGLPENGSCDKLFDVPFVGEEKHPEGFAPILVSCSSEKPQAGAGGQSSQSSQVETLSLGGNEELNESGSTCSGAADIDNISQSIEKGSSKWQIKGKRNSRNTSKNKRQDSRKYKDINEESKAYLTSLEHRAFTESQINDYWGWSGHISCKAPHEVKLLPDCSQTTQRSLPYRQSRFILNPKYQTSDFPLRNYDMGSCLYDVNLEVKASYRPQHVPYISLMSKLNSQPIIGHPLTVEVLDDGFCDLLVTGPGLKPECYFTSSSCDLDDLEENDTSALEGVDMDYEVKPNLGGGRVPTKRLPLHRVSPSKSPKTRKNGHVSKKIRKLSSLTGTHRRIEDEKKPVVEKIKGPAVACVPLKVVFSRINASLNGSMRSVKFVS
ncbi:hypothetical protein C3L33_00194, partial [Rhododendron williamsianum]